MYAALNNGFGLECEWIDSVVTDVRGMHDTSYCRKKSGPALPRCHLVNAGIDYLWWWGTLDNSAHRWAARPVPFNAGLFGPACAGDALWFDRASTFFVSHTCAPHFFDTLVGSDVL